MALSLKKLRDNFLLWLVTWLGPVLIWLLGRSLRITWEGLENLEEVRKKGEKVLWSFWHGRLLILCFSRRKQQIHVLVSEHRDGEYIARAIKGLGFVAVRGSTTKGGAKAILQMVAKGQAGYDIAISPDGPKGPRYKVQPGAIYIAQRSGLPILPMSSSAQKTWRLASWDNFLIPKPFSKTIITLGKPIYVPKDLSPEEFKAKICELENVLIELTNQADNFFTGKN